MAVDDTSAVAASIKKIETSGELTAAAGVVILAGKLRQPLRKRIDW